MKTIIKIILSLLYLLIALPFFVISDIFLIIFELNNCIEISFNIKPNFFGFIILLQTIFSYSFAEVYNLYLEMSLPTFKEKNNPQMKSIPLFVMLAFHKVKKIFITEFKNYKWNRNETE